MVFAASESAATLSNERLRLTLAVRDWLVGEAHEISDPNVIIEGLCLKLRDAGVPLDQAVSAIELRHAERAANARIWEFGSPAREHIYGHERGSEATGKRPLAEAHRLNEWIFSWLSDMADDTYDIVAPPQSRRLHAPHCRSRRAAERHAQRLHLRHARQARLLRSGYCGVTVDPSHAGGASGNPRAPARHA